jgi:hypothetical protein
MLFLFLFFNAVNATMNVGVCQFIFVGMQCPHVKPEHLPLYCGEFVEIEGQVAEVNTDQAPENVPALKPDYKVEVRYKICNSNNKETDDDKVANNFHGSAICHVQDGAVTCTEETNHLVDRKGNIVFQHDTIEDTDPRYSFTKHVAKYAKVAANFNLDRNNTLALNPETMYHFKETDKGVFGPAPRIEE